MICFADIGITEVSWESFAVGLVLGAIFGIALLGMAARIWGEPPKTALAPEHRCPFCGHILRAITVREIGDVKEEDHPIPPDATWVCPNGNCKAWYFADRSPAGKPAPIEEV